jgi:mannose-6-phosphate isomerase-like protein (cupin superfamily)
MPGATVVRKGEATTVSAGPDESLTFHVSSQVTGDRYTFLEGTAGYLSGPPLHVHFGQDEVIHIVEGQLKVQCGTHMYDLNPGDSIYIERGTPHTFTNLDPNTPVRMFGMSAPGGFDAFMTEYVGLLEQGTPTPEQMEALGRQYKTIASGPPLAVTLGR